MATNLEQVFTQNVKCSICLDHFNEPKLLACSHTFCLNCLANLYEAQQQNRDQISCPQCRKFTKVQDGDVSTLQTNIQLKSMVQDVENASTGKQICTNCDSDDKPLAETYCQECEEYMCVSCHQTHDKWKKHSGHQVIMMADVKSGKSSVKKRRKCMTHRDEEEQFFCIDCNTYVCFRCRVLEHDKVGHHVVDKEEHENNVKKNIKSLQEQADKTEMEIQKYIDLVKEQRKKMKILFKQRTNEINQAYEESMHQLKQIRNSLVNECKEYELKLQSKFESLEDESRKQITSVSRAKGLVGNGMKATPEGQALTVHDTLCRELQEILGNEPDYTVPKKITECAEKLKFKRHDVLELGSIEKPCWRIKQDIALPTKDSMNAMASMPDGRMAVGSSEGGIHAFSLDGREETMFKDVRVRELSFLSNGCCVVRDTTEKITLYTPQWKKVDVQFDALGWDVGGLAVDKDDYIYVGYRGDKKIQVFKPTGGKAVREITCDGYAPHQMFSIKSKKLLVVKSMFTVKLLDQCGKLKPDQFTKPSGCMFPAVCRDNTILIAWVKHKNGLVTIKKYSHELKYLETLVTDYKIQRPKRDWYYLQEFLSGEVAFCTTDRLYIFTQFDVFGR